MRIAILDDDSDLNQSLKRNIQNIIPQDISPLFIEIFENPVCFLEACKREKYDILFLDLQIGEMNGIEVGKMLLEDDHKMLIIIMSAYDYRYESYTISPIQYLTKPINENQLKETLIRALQLNQKKYILFKSYTCQIPIELKSVLLIETCYDEVCIKTSDKIYKGAKRSNCDCLKIFTLLSFHKLDRSRIINFDHIKHINQSWITMSNGEMIEIPKMRRTSFKKNYFLFLENI